MKVRRLLWLLLLCSYACDGCSGDHEAHDHSEEHPEGHDHHAEGHGHGDTPMIRITRWTEDLELFAEHAEVVAGVENSMLAHLTILDGFRPVTSGSVQLELTGPADVSFMVGEPVRPGIFDIDFTAPAPGLYQGSLSVAGFPDPIEGFEIHVVSRDDHDHSTEDQAHGHEHEQGAGEHAHGDEEHDHGDDEHDHGDDEHDHGDDEHDHGDEEHAHGDDEQENDGHEDDHGHGHAERSDEGLIELLKEQQWGVPFGTHFVTEGTLVSSVEVAGSVETPPGGSAEVGAPTAGRIVAPREGLPHPGTVVREGQVLATLSPAPSSPENTARATLVVAEAEARAAGARSSLGRAERLIRSEAISQSELEEIQREVQVADESVRAARRAAAMFSGARTGRGPGTWRLASPIDGTVTRVHATPGASVSPGDVLFEIVNDSELWIRARVPEQDATLLRRDRDAHYRISGLDEWFTIPISSQSEDGSTESATLVNMGRTIDPVTRTVDVIYALPDPHASLRVGGLIQVSLPAGEDFEGALVPRTAIVEDEGRQVVYVQVDGEHFEERLVRTGPESAGLIGIELGVSVGERVVTRGANLVRLADRAASGGGEAHGHIH